MLVNTLFGIAYDCPYCKRSYNCPLNEVNSLSFERKVKWIEALDHYDMTAIIKHHDDCSYNRQKTPVIENSNN